MRVLHLTSAIGRKAGGMGAVVTNLVPEQRSLGMQSKILCFDPPHLVDHTLRDNELRGAIIYKRIIGPRQVGYSPKGESWMSGPGGDFDVVHQHGVWTASSRLTNRWRKCFGRPTIVAPLGTFQPAALARSKWKKKIALVAYERENLDSASCIQSTSPLETEALRTFGLKNPIAVIPLGISSEWLRQQGDAERFRARFSIPLESRLMLFVSRLHPIKGIPLLIRSFTRIHSRGDNWHLIIAGPDERGHRHEIEMLVSQLKMGDFVRLVGPLEGQLKRDAFAAAELFVLPSHSEAFGIAIVEALGAGLPVLTTKGTPWNELRETDSGWWIDLSGSELDESLRSAMQKNRSELQAMGARGKLLVSNKYTWANVAKSSEEVYFWLLNGGQPPECVLID